MPEAWASSRCYAIVSSSASLVERPIRKDVANGIDFDVPVISALTRTANGRIYS